jgi:hypothetical protein
MGWIGTEDEDVYPEFVPEDPFPFTREGRRMQALEHQLRLEQARLNVDRLQARKRELLAALRRSAGSCREGLTLSPSRMADCPR